MVQESPTSILVRLVAASQPDAYVLSCVAGSIKEYLGGVQVVFDFPKRIERMTNGKRQIVIPFSYATAND